MNQRNETDVEKLRQLFHNFIDMGLHGRFEEASYLMEDSYVGVGMGEQVPISVSIGIACGRARVTFEKLYHIADIALYTAKKAGKCRYHLINSDTNVEGGHSGAGANLLSLQTLLNYTYGKEIAESKTPYEALVENIPGNVLIISLSDRIRLTHCNDWVCRFTDYTMEEIEEIQKDNALALIHPDDLPRTLESVRQMYEGLDNVCIPFRLRRKNGSYGHVQIDATITERTKDEIIFYGIETDVEEPYRLRKKLEDSRMELEAFINSIPGGVISIILDDGVQLNHRNDWVSRFLGYDIEEIAEIEKENAFALLCPDDLPCVAGALERMRAGEDFVNIIYRLMAKDGQYRPVRISASLRERGLDKIIYYGVVTDVEEMITVQNELEYTNKKLEALLAAIPCGIAVYEISDTLKTTQYGTWLYKFSGYTSNEEIAAVREEKWLATVWPEDIPKTTEALQRVRTEDVDKFFLCIRLKCKDGTPKAVNIHASVIDRTPSLVTMYVIYTELED